MAAVVSAATTMAFAQAVVAPAPNGITIPEGYKDWPVIGVSARTDNNTLRVIIGNDVAIEAARSGQTNPWPEGSILGKLVFPQRADPNWAAANVPDGFRHAEFMIKDSAAYAATGGWGYARWLGADQRPYGADANFAQECFACHTPVADRDYVFSTPATLP
jgi:hypothetical protein